MLSHRKGVLLDGIGSELVRASTGGVRKTLSKWLGDLSSAITLGDVADLFTSGDATPSVLNNSKFITAGSTTITNFTNGVEGQTITIYRGASDIGIADNATIDPIIAGTLTLSTARPSATFRLASGVWKQVEEAGALSTAMTAVVQAATLALGRIALGISSAMDAVITSATTALARTALGVGGSINVTDPVWGIVGDGVTVNTTAMATLRAYLAALPAGSVPKVIWPAGIYVYATSPNWAITGLHMEFQGDCRLRCTGAGNSMDFDAGAAGYAWDIAVTGWPKIEGHDGSAHGVYLRGILHSTLQLNVRGCGTTSDAILMEFCVCTHLDTPIVSNNEGTGGAFYNDGTGVAKPRRGIVVTRRGAGAEKSGHCMITNAVIEGVAYAGMTDDYAVGTLWQGGTSEGHTDATNARGYLNTANAVACRVIDVDFEANASSIDIDISGDETELRGCHSEDEVFVRSGANDNVFIGGDYEDITIIAGATDTRLRDCRYSRYGAGVFTDGGTRTIYDIQNITTDTRSQSDISDTAYNATSWDGVTGIAPSKNAVRDKVEAITATTVSGAGLATGGGDLSANRTITVAPSVISGHLYGCTLSNNGSDATNDIDITAGNCIDSTNAVLMTCAAMTKRLDANWAAGTNQGFRYSGAAIANTTYHIYAASKADGTQDYYADPSATIATVLTHLQAETGGSAYLYLRRIGSIIRVGAAIKAFVQDGDYFAIAPTFEFSGGIGGPTGARTNYTLANVPTGFVFGADLDVTITDATPAAATYVGVTWPTQAAFTPSVAQHSFMIPAAGIAVPQAGSSRARINTNTSAQVAVEIVGTTADHTLYGCTHGWTDTRGRLA